MFTFLDVASFNTQPPEGGWTIKINDDNTLTIVSTHSRLKAAGRRAKTIRASREVSTHSRLKAAGQDQKKKEEQKRVSTHSRLKAAGYSDVYDYESAWVSTHSRLKAAGFFPSCCFGRASVSTHSRLKAAGQSPCSIFYIRRGFNTQPPEGGWSVSTSIIPRPDLFQHTAA